MLLPHPRRSTDPRQSHKGLFAHPPAPRSFKTTGLQLLRDLLAIEVRAALCYAVLRCAVLCCAVPSLRNGLSVISSVA